MHPRIKKFWEDSGYILKSDTAYFINEGGKKELEIMWWAYPCNITNESALRIKQVSLKTDSWDSTTYYFNNKAYTEDHMLKIVALKAFI